MGSEMVRQQTEEFDLAFAGDHEGRGVLSSVRSKSAVLAKTKFLLISLQISPIPSFYMTAHQTEQSF